MKSAMEKLEKYRRDDQDSVCDGQKITESSNPPATAAATSKISDRVFTVN